MGQHVTLVGNRALCEPLEQYNTEDKPMKNNSEDELLLPIHSGRLAQVTADVLQRVQEELVVAAEHKY